MHLKDDLELATGNFIYDPVIGCENRLGSFYKNNHYLEDDLLDRHENNFTLDDIEDFNAGFTRLDSPSEYSDDSIYDLFNNQTSNLLFGNNTQGSLSDSFSFDDDQSLLSSTSTSSALNFNDDRDQFFDLDLFNEDSGSNEEVFPTVQL
uniref:C2H2-type domain-containing protein n=1 Tax=Panagrolaimus sp. JU765 TaxID=591449 RepID=A0AC34RRR7_9BILA